MTDAIRELKALRARYRKAGKLREAKAMDNAISLLHIKQREAKPIQANADRAIA